MTLDDLRKKYRDQFDPTFAGFECGPGWTSIMDHVLFILHTARSPARIYRVKEKIGSLRIRTTTPLEPLVHDMVLAAELRSEEVCEICGARGRIYRAGGWVRTRCETHVEDGTLP